MGWGGVGWGGVGGVGWGGWGGGGGAGRATGIKRGGYARCGTPVRTWRGRCWWGGQARDREGVKRASRSTEDGERGSRHVGAGGKRVGDRCRCSVRRCRGTAPFLPMCPASPPSHFVAIDIIKVLSHDVASVQAAVQCFARGAPNNVARPVAAPSGGHLLQGRGAREKGVWARSEGCLTDVRGGLPAYLRVVIRGGSTLACSSARSCRRQHFVRMQRVHPLLVTPHQQASCNTPRRRYHRGGSTNRGC